MLAAELVKDRADGTLENIDARGARASETTPVKPVAIPKLTVPQNSSQPSMCSSILNFTMAITFP